MNLVEHLNSRDLDLTKHKVWLDEENYLATFPLYNLFGQLMGYQQYRPKADKMLNNNPREGRYFKKVNNNQPSFWGLESFYSSNTMFITEGIFDACKLTKLGYSAVAMLSNDVPYVARNWLYLMSKIRPVVMVCDNDPAGLVLSEYSSFLVVKDYKDLGECPLSYVRELVKNYD